MLAEGIVRPHQSVPAVSVNTLRRAGKGQYQLSHSLNSYPLNTLSKDPRLQLSLILGTLHSHNENKFRIEYAPRSTF